VGYVAQAERHSPEAAKRTFTLKDVQDLSRLEQQLRPFMARLRTLSKVMTVYSLCQVIEKGASPAFIVSTDKRRTPEGRKGAVRILQVVNGQHTKVCLCLAPGIPGDGGARGRNLCGNLTVKCSSCKRVA
jgi:hypothetical protein